MITAMPGIHEIAKSVALYYGVSVDALKGTDRHASIVRARHVAMFLARTRIGYTMEDIGWYFGGRDHSTIVHAVQKVTRETAAHEEFRNQVAYLAARVRTAA